MEDFLSLAIQNDQAIRELFSNPDGSHRPPHEWFFSSTSLGIGPNTPVPERPYLVWSELTDTVHHEVSETSNSRTRNFQHFIYDHKGDFTRINQILSELRRIVKSIAPFETDEGVRCSEARWMSMSHQIADDGWDSCARFASTAFTVSE